MVLHITCRCDAKFDINSLCIKTNGDIRCPSCGRPLPAEASKYARETFLACGKLYEALGSVDYYEIKID